MHELQQILLQKLPRLGKLDFGCQIQFIQPTKYEKYPAEFYKKNAQKEDEYIGDGIWTIEYRDHNSRNETYYHKIGKGQGGYHSYETIQTTQIGTMIKDGKCVILGKPASHSDILEALGEDWAMTGNYKLVFERTNFKMYLPKNLSDLSLPEYEETRKQLIQLLTK